MSDPAPPAPARVPARVVSLVPSLTEAVAETVPGLLVGATNWCTHPAGLDVARLGGTKNPDVAGIVATRPDLVVVNSEENRAPDIDALRAAGLRVHVTDPETVPQALAQLRTLLRLLGASRVGWLDVAERVWAQPWSGARRRALVPIWRRPWMALGRDTFAGDVLARLGVDNALAGSPERYPRRPGCAHRARAGVRPGGPARRAVRLRGRRRPGGVRRLAVRAGVRAAPHVYGPSLAEARDVLAGQLVAAR